MYRLVFLILIMKFSSCQRRITNGSSVDLSANTHFMVSIVSATAEDNIKGWLCGGSIIHPQLILTAASCLHTANKMYAIAGYRKYVRTEDLHSNVCTSHLKHRIVYFCLHSEYGELRSNKGDKHTSEERRHKWTIFDIGIARTEHPIDFFDHDYIKYCSYLPTSIQMNFHKKFEQAGSDAVIYGWGHAEFYRPIKNVHNYNMDALHYTSTKIMKSKDCLNRYKSRYIKAQISNHYICTDEKGGLNAFGRNLVHTKASKYLCARERRSGTGNFSQIDRKQYENCINSTKTKSSNTTLNVSRRNGICQNDHGSPLIRWIGGHPFVIGVASAFQVNKQMKCVGPYLFTSTHCTNRFLNCVLARQSTKSLTENLKNNLRTSSLCNASDIERGFKMEERYISWNDEKPQTTTEDDLTDLYDSIEIKDNI